MFSLNWLCPNLGLKFPIIWAYFITTGFCVSRSWTLFLCSTPHHHPPPPPGPGFLVLFRGWSFLTWYGSFLLQLLELSSVDLISKGNAYISSRQNAANKFLNKVFKVRLGRGFYGECLVIIAHYILDFYAII